MGFKTVEIENEWVEYTGLPHAHFLSSATAGLHLAFEVLKKKHQHCDLHAFGLHEFQPYEQRLGPKLTRVLYKF
nr:hypothetical protein [Vibrio panuliri]